MQKLQSYDGDVVLDRFHLGELVYGPIYRGVCQLDDQKFRNIELLAMSKYAVIIYCLDTVGHIAERFDEDNETWARKDKIVRALKLYDKALKKTILPVYTHQMMTGNDLLLNRVELDNIIDSNEFTYTYNQVVGNVIYPKLILVGDKRNKKGKYNKVGQPFDFGPSSKFLFDSLKKANIRLQDVMILNSDNKNLKTYISQVVGFPKVIALGVSSSKKLLKSKIKHFVLNHPQYENRFHKYDSKFYLKLKKIYAL
jgi:hypothetical protein